MLCTGIDRGTRLSLLAEVLSVCWCAGTKFLLLNRWGSLNLELCDTSVYSVGLPITSCDIGFQIVWCSSLVVKNTNSIMLAGANPSGVFTVSLNPAAPTLSQPATSSIQSFPSASAIILPQPVQQVGQGTIPQLVSGGQIVNLTPVRATNQTVNTTPTSKNHSCPFCHKSFSSR